MVDAVSIEEWQALAREDPAGAARELVRRRAALPPDQAAAIWAWQPDLKALQAAFADHRAGPLAGVPYALKDLFPVRGVPTRAGGRLLRPPVPTADAKIVRTLHSAGAVLAGKTHLHEFAYGLTGENPHYGNVVHPRFPDRTSGGSSSGSAAAVAAGVVPLAIGTDTAGSIRVPAAFCGLYGFRLVPQDLWISDAFPLAPTFDTAGWFTATAADLLRVKRALLGATTAPARVPRGVSLSAGDLAVAMEVHDAQLWRHAADRLAPEADSLAVEALASAFQDCASAYVVLQSAEAYRVHAATLDAERELYGEVVWQRLDRGRHWSAGQIAEAQVKLQVVRDAWRTFFRTYDFLVLPAASSVALRHDDLGQARREAQLALTTPASLGGLPVLTVPVARADGLTLGLQIVVESPTSPALAWVLEQAPVL